MFIKQISVFLENAPGTLRELTELLGKANIDLMAISVADTQSFGIIRIIIGSEQIDPAMDLLKANGYIAKVNNVICAEVEDRPLGLCELLDVIDKAGLSVEYMYSFMRPAGENAHIVLRLSDKQKAVKVFQLNNIKVLNQAAIDTM